MKKRNLIIIGIISAILVVAGLVTSYIDSARARNSIEPKFAIKITTDGVNKVTYWGLGYKVIRYPSVSPNEPYKNNLGVKYGSWFMRYELSNYENIDIELLMDGKTIQLSRTRDIEFIIRILEDSKYINEVCDGINSHKIVLDNEIYYIKDGCGEIQKGRKQAKISQEDLNKFLKIIDDYNEIYVNNEENNPKEAQIIETINTSFTTYYKMSDGTWQCNGNSYKYRLQITGKMSSAAKSSTFVYLSNIEDIPFERAYKAAGFSSSTADYYSVEDAIFIDCFNGE
ncbi:MAG: hypothetical protein IJE68_03080 [Clostridia bacterium]|nr:hypothetical protein [Clostridia bacterium]